MLSSPDLGDPSRRELLKLTAGFGVLAAACGYGIWVVNETPRDDMPNMFDGALRRPYELDRKEHLKWVQKIEAHLVKAGDFREIALKEDIKVRDRAEEWAEAIVNAMERAGVPISEKTLRLALTLLHRESRLEVDPEINMTNAYKRYRAALDDKIQELAPEAGEFRDYIEEQIAYFDERYGDRIKNAKTEGELDAVLSELRAQVEPAMDGAYTFLPAEEVKDLWRQMNRKLRVKTLGALQVSGDIAAQYYEARGEHDITEEEARRRLLTLDGNLEVGFALFFAGYDAYEGQENQVHFAFADYNSGLYSSRNAGFQEMVAALSGRKLVLDGDCLMYDGRAIRNDMSNTERAIHRIENLGALWDGVWTEDALAAAYMGAREAKIRKPLVWEKTSYFSRDPFYRRVSDLYSERTGDSPIRARIPSASDPGAQLKYGRDFSTEDYVEESMQYVRAFKW